jgi:hypothetical protein
MREFQLGVIGGALYGSTHTLAGHSLDNLKVLGAVVITLPQKILHATRTPHDR